MNKELINEIPPKLKLERQNAILFYNYENPYINNKLNEFIQFYNTNKKYIKQIYNRPKYYKKKEYNIIMEIDF